MRQLLTRWAELEPDEFNQDNLDEISDPESLASAEVQAKIQYAIQALVVNRGWTLNLEWDGEWYVWLADKWTGQDLSSPAKAILEAYVAALEVSR